MELLNMIGWRLTWSILNAYLYAECAAPTYNNDIHMRRLHI